MKNNKTEAILTVALVLSVVITITLVINYLANGGM